MISIALSFCPTNNSIEEVYFGKAKDVVGDLRSMVFTLSISQAGY